MSGPLPDPDGTDFLSFPLLIGPLRGTALSLSQESYFPVRTDFCDINEALRFRTPYMHTPLPKCKEEAAICSHGHKF